MSSTSNNDGNEVTDTDSTDNSDDDTSNNDKKDILDEVLPIDIACQRHQQPTESDISVLTNGIPPIHFLFLPQCYRDNESRECTIDYIISSFPNNAAVYHDGKLPLHQACKVKASLETLKKILNIYPNGITQETTNNNDTALHCYLSSSKTSTNQETKKTVTFLVDKNVDVLTVQNNNGWYPIHIVAYRNQPIEIIYYLAKNAPVTIIRNEQIH